MPHLKVKRQNFFFSRILGGLDGNALGCAIFEPMWAIFGGMIFFYAPLYMKSLGVSEVQMGFINSFGAVCGVITAFLAGPITDRLGRRRTTLIFDFIAWSLTMAIWAVSQNFWFFLVAAFTNAFFRIPNTSWTCLAIEDTPVQKRAVFFSLISIINLGSGVFALLNGMLIGHIGITKAMRIVYGLGCISMSLMFLGRNHITEETAIGKKLIAHHSNISFKEKKDDYILAMKYLVSNRLTLVSFIIVLLTNFQASFSFFMVVYLKDVIQMSASVVSAIPGISAVINLFIYFVFIPKLMKKDETHNLTFGLILMVLGSATFLLVRPGMYWMLLLSTTFTAIGNMVASTFRETLWNNVIGEGERAKIFSACQGVISIIGIPSGAIAGIMYKANPMVPFMVNLLIFTVTLGCAAYTVKVKRQLKESKSYKY